MSTMNLDEASKNLGADAASQLRIGGPDLEARLLSEVPMPPRMFYYRFWRSQFDVERVQYIEEVCLDQRKEPPIKQPSCCGCCRYY